MPGSHKRAAPSLLVGRAASNERLLLLVALLLLLLLLLLLAKKKRKRRCAAERKVHVCASYHIILKYDVPSLKKLWRRWGAMFL